MDLFHQNWFSVRMEMLITYRAWFAPDQLHPLTLHFWRFPNSVSFSCDWVTHLKVKLLLYWFFFKIQICLGELPTPWLDSIRFPEFIRSLLSSLDNTEQHPREKKKKRRVGILPGNEETQNKEQRTGCQKVWVSFWDQQLLISKP